MEKQTICIFINIDYRAMKNSFYTLISFLALLLATSVNAQYATTTASADKFEHLLRIIDRFYVDSVNNEKMVEHAIKGLLKELDPHSVYITKKEVDEMNEPLVGNFEGVGIQFNILHDTITVVSPISGGPSEKLGILAGDKIVIIDEENVGGIGITNKGVMDRLRGKKGTEVTVDIKRRNVKDLIEYTITRDKIPIYSVDATYMATPEVGYMKINRFSATTMKEFRSGLDTLQTQGMKHLILDLRGNPGGYLKTAIDMADEFLSSRKLIVYTEGRSFPKDEKYATSTKNRFETGKLVVLVDEASASASEIVAGAIQDHDRGLILGRRTFGKGLVQKPYPLPDGSMVRVTISRYYTPTGRSIQKPYQEYKDDFSKRLERGEFFNRDSIDFPDSLKYYTPKKRIVYGGGGIMPDIFIPWDTTMNSDYYRNIARKGLLNQFALTYLDLNRKQMEQDYQDIHSYKAGFNVEGEVMDSFIEFAEKEGVEKDAKGIETSSKLISTQLKALIARDFWKSNGYYQVRNDIDHGYQKAIEVMQDGTFKKMDLAAN